MKKKSDKLSMQKIDKVPSHVAIIMDGNNRWAKKRLLPGVAGHRAGVEAIRKVLAACDELGVACLTLFAFSSENWQRPAKEVSALMDLFLSYLKKEVKQLHSNNIRLSFIGRRDRLDAKILKEMEAAESLTLSNTGSHLILAVDYGGCWDIASAAQKVCRKVLAGELQVDKIDEQLLDQSISLSQLPKPDLCIRTGGDHRISNFMLWQFAYAELYFTDCLWPDFDEQAMCDAVSDFSRRQRRFGGRQDDADV